MNISDYIHANLAKQRQAADANESAAAMEEMRRQLNAEKLARTLTEFIRPRLLNAREQIVSKGVKAEVETKLSTDGTETHAVILTISNGTVVQNFTLSYIADRNTAVLTATISTPSKAEYLGKFDPDGITTHTVDSHALHLVALAFP